MRKLASYSTGAFFQAVAYIAVACSSFAAGTAGAQTMPITKSVVGATTVPSGQDLTYGITYSCSAVGVGATCNGVQITDPLPAGLVFVQALGTSDVASITAPAVGSNGTVVFNFIPAVPAGNSGTLTVTVRFPNGVTPNGTTALNTATVTGSNIPAQSASAATVTATASFAINRTKTVAQGLYVYNAVYGNLTESVYTVSHSIPSENGRLNISNISIIDTLPAGAIFVSASGGGVCDDVLGGACNSGAQNRVTWSGLNLTVGNTINLSVRLRFPSPPFSAGNQVTNEYDSSGQPVGEPVRSLGPTIGDTSTLQTFNPNPGAALGKGFSGGYNNPRQGQTFLYELNPRNTGNVAIDAFTVVDRLPAASDYSLIEVTSGIYNPNPAITVTVEYERSDAPGVFNAWGTSPSNANATFTVASLGLPGGVSITRVRWVYGTVDPGFQANTRPRLRGTVLAAAGSTVQNCRSASWTFAGSPGSISESCFSFTVSGPYTTSSPVKRKISPAGSGPFSIGQVITWELEARNEGVAGDPLTDPILTDLLPFELGYVSGTATGGGGPAAGGTGTIGPVTFTSIPNFAGTGKTLLRFTFSGTTLNPGQTATVRFDTSIQLGASFGTLTNTFGQTHNGSPAIRCGTSQTDTLDQDGDGSVSDLLCVASSSINVAPVAQIEAKKSVRAICDAVFSEPPAEGNTYQGGTIDWRIRLRNIATVPLTNFTIVDILPAVGDTGVRDTSARLSQFTPFLVAPITPPAGATVYYSTQLNPCRGEVGGPVSGCSPPAWSTVPPSPLSNVRSFKIEFGTNLTLGPGDQFIFEFRTVVPSSALAGQIAWNSFGYQGQRADNGLVVGGEPNKVGARITCVPTSEIGNFVWIDTNANGIQDPGEPGLNGVDVELYTPGADGIARTLDDILYGSTITSNDSGGNSGWYLFPILPPGSYYVRFQIPAGYLATVPDAGADTADSDGDVSTGLTPLIVLPASTSDLTIDMGLRLAPAALGNYVWFDVNADGIQNDPVSSGVNGVRVRLYRDLNGNSAAEPGGADGAPVTTVATADDIYGIPGYYLFPNLIPNVGYFVEFVRPTASASAFTTSDAGGNDTLDSDVAAGTAATATTPVVIMAPGEFNGTLDAGLVPLTGSLSLGDTVWLDSDNDGAYDFGTEAGVNGVTLTLYRDSNNDTVASADEFFATTTTATLTARDGRYLFRNLPAGNYIVQVDPSNFLGGHPLFGTATSTGNDPAPDPDDDADGDDNGRELTSSAEGVFSLPVTLSAGGEPVFEDGSNNSNWTVDFGFYPAGVPALSYDFGDAPDTGFSTATGDYQTVATDNGPYHQVSPLTFLGSCVDADSGFQQNLLAAADDAGSGPVTGASCADDEDGVVFSGLIVRGTPAAINLTVGGGAATQYLSAWIDWNGDGDFLDAGEQIAAGLAVAPGPVSLTPSVPVAARLGITYARFRISDSAVASPTGFGGPGEVEDYRIQIVDTDFGDAPDSYTTLLTSNGPRHVIVANYSLGLAIDGETTGAPAAPGSAATGDDTAGTPDDEDGVTFPYTVLGATRPVFPRCSAGVPVQVRFINGTFDIPGGRLDAWLDLDGNGSFLDPGEQIASNLSLSPGINNLSVAVPCTATLGVSYLRVRLSSVGGLSPSGPADDGEVEDYDIEIRDVDFGDAPASFPTLGTSAAQHVIVNPPGSFSLGTNEDREADGQASAGADGDDLNGVPDDEDGVAFAAGSAFVACSTGNPVIVTLSNTAGIASPRLSAFIDWNRDGDFADPGEQIFSDILLAAGANNLTFNAPCTLTPGTSHARFRLSNQTGVGPAGAVANGEVEDYLIVLRGADFGDAPSTYGTTVATSGARHGVLAGFSLGALVDGETDGQPNATATGDGADEDGVTGLPANPVACTSSVISVALTNSAGVLTPRLDVFFDVDRNGDFAGAGERLVASQALAAGSNSVTLNIPCNAVPGQSYLRFRLSDGGSASPTGQSPLGEVEDYTVTTRGVDLGDAPDTYTTLRASSGPNHVIVPGFSLGAAIDTEADGQPSAAANGDDLSGVPDDEDGVVITGNLLRACQSESITVTLTNTAGIATHFLDGFVDWNADGDFVDPGEQVFTSQPLALGANNLTIAVPCGLTAGSSHARFRLSSTGGLGPSGAASNGEVEDYQVQFRDADFGDAPDTYGTTLAASGPRHTILPGFSLGAAIDRESDGQPSVSANGDDTNNTPDDEDGVSFTPPVLVACSTGNTVTVSLTNTAAAATPRLDAWIDWNLDGDFLDAGEQIFTSQLLNSGANSLTFSVPCDASAGASFTRFRLSSAGALTPTGAAADGEVEDHPVPVRGLDFGDAPNSYGTQLPGGGNHVVIPGFSLGNTVDTETDGQPNVAATGDGADEDGISGLDLNPAACWSNTVTVTLTNSAGITNPRLDVFFDVNRNGSFGPGEQIVTGQALVAGANLVTLNYPCTSVPGQSYLRFRLSDGGVLTATGQAASGEIEDYAVTTRYLLDFGDAPNTYETLDASSGPRHIIQPGFSLGSLNDQESDGVPTAGADGDDTAVSDDEDGITIQDNILRGCQANTITVVLTNSAAVATAFLDAFVDWDRDGTFSGAGEHVLVSQLLAAGSNSLTVTAPCSFNPGLSYARFRLSTAGGLGFSGSGGIGEVEDYRVRIAELDYGDAPDTYATTRAAGGARHILFANYSLGPNLDGEPDGAPATVPNPATGDDTTGTPDDEDGVTFSYVPAGSTRPVFPVCSAGVPITVNFVNGTSISGGRLDAWLDLDRNGSFLDAGEHVITNVALNTGNNSLSIPVPCAASPGVTYMRFRLSSAGGLTPSGQANDGEVEDYDVLLENVDFGDAPDTYGTQGASSAWHGIVSPPGSFALGSSVDREADGQPNAAASGDDTDGTPDDEDGVTFGFGTALAACSTGNQITVLLANSASIASPRLAAWIDWNRNGSFSDPGEQIFVDQALVSGPNNLTFSVPCGLNPGTSYARFRLSGQSGLGPVGGAGDGEVEDYRLELRAADFGDAPSSYGTLLPGGARHGVAPGFSLGAAIDGETEGQPSSGASADGSDEDGVSGLDLTPPACWPDTITVTLTNTASFSDPRLDAFLDVDRNGDFLGFNEHIVVSQALTPGSNTVTLNYPCSAQPGLTYLRFRLSEGGISSPVGQSPSGEVEDYAVTARYLLDFGDAPNSYATLNAANGANHIIRPGFSLGLLNDPETDGVPSTLANGDDTSGTDDEDGVLIAGNYLSGCQDNLISVVLTDTTGSGEDSLLDGFVDFNRDGDFGDPGEHAVVSFPLVSGVNLVPVPVPCSFSAGLSYARFRLSTFSEMSPDGSDGTGEVEDYQVRLALSDFGDAPDSYATTAAANGPRHAIVANFSLGQNIDGELNGAPVFTGGPATGDDTAGSPDDEDGVSFPYTTAGLARPVFPICSADVPVNVTFVNGSTLTAGFLDAWIDWNLDGDFLDAGEQIAASRALTVGVNNLSIPVPCSVTPGVTYMRFRLSSTGGLTPFGPASNGEVEDYRVELRRVDFGDAPASYGTQGAAAAWHIIIDPPGSFSLGSNEDAETDGHPSPAADGDDTTETPDDEDGVVFASGSRFVACSLSNAVTVTLSNSSGTPDPKLYGFFDWNGDGDFSDPGEDVFKGVPLVPGANSLTFDVPCTATPGSAYARFRLSNQPGVGPVNGSANGEVEDYLITILGVDFGDAPNTYGTAMPDGARHGILPGFFLGASIDGETDGLPNPGATGDGADEDGVTGLPGAPAACSSSAVTVTLTNTAGVADPRLDVFFDANLDGDFLDAGERIVAAQLLNSGSNLVTLNFPCSLVPGTSYIRFRLSDGGVSSPVGASPAGEVEDYVVTNSLLLDRGDAPDSYRTVQASNGPSHLVKPGFSLGTLIDADLDALPAATANGDDVTGVDDEDGITIPGNLLRACETTIITVSLTNTPGSLALLDGFIDWNRDGDFLDAGEQIATSRPLLPGNNSLSVTAPCDFSPGTSFARFRLGTTGSLGPFGAAGPGEVEDYQIQLALQDFGDAPDSYGTSLAANGPRHLTVAGFSLGLSVDTESNATPAPALAPATGDDSDGIPDDEDGVTFPFLPSGASRPVFPVCSAGVPVNVTFFNASALSQGRLDAWIDLNGNGSFLDVGEQVVQSLLLAPGVNSISIPVPCTATPGISYMRFRLSSTGGLSPLGQASDGEVEDYDVEIRNTDFGDAPSSYKTQGAESAWHAILSPAGSFALGSHVDREGDGQPSSAATGDDQAGDPDDEDGVVFTTGTGFAACSPLNTVTVTLANAAAVSTPLLSVFADWNRDGDFEDSGESVFLDKVLTAGPNSVTFSVPCSVEPGVSYLRFRLSSQAGLGPAGGALDGEVEDYRVELRANDFGDAPATYGTSLPSGARHGVLPGFALGSAIDSEPDGQPSADATGDGVDEDGVAGLPSTPVACSMHTVTVTLTNSAAVSDPRLDVFFDENNDGGFLGATEHIVVSQALVPGANPITLNFPCSAQPGQSYLRFRLSDGGISLPTGASPSGEVEDYSVLTRGLDLGDAPDSYTTLRGSSGPSHVILPGFSLGTLNDSEPEASPSAAANGDDVTGSDDEDGVTFQSPVIQLCISNSLTVFLTNSALVATPFLDGFIDWNGDGDFLDENEHVLASQPLVAGPNALSFNAPCQAASGMTYARFRLSSTGGLSPSGPSASGEVEDYLISLRPIDFGDAPASYGTTLSVDGARHLILPGFSIGSYVDSEADGQPGAAANGDDTNGSPDDEDGAVFASNSMAVCTQGNLVTVQVTNAASVPQPRLDAFIDWNRDGDFLDASEQVFTNLAVLAGPNQLSFAVPCSAVPGQTYARFRLSSAGALSPVGLAADGEVEDYILTLHAETDLSITKTDGVAVAVPGGILTYTIVATNNGPLSVTGATVSDSFPSSITSAAWTCAATSGSSCGTASGAGNISATVNLALGGSATFTVTASVSSSASGSLTNAVSITPPPGILDPLPDNNTASDTDTLAPVLDLSIVKTGPAALSPGEAISYTIDVQNAGPSDAILAAISDTVPPEITGVSWSCTAFGGAVCRTPGGTGNVINLNADMPARAGLIRLSVNGTISLAATGVLQNTAYVAPAPGISDPNINNNASTALTVLAPRADLKVAKAGPANYSPGQEITYSLTVTNLGPAAVANARVTDTVPDVITGVIWTCQAAGLAQCGAPSGGGNSVVLTANISPGPENFLTVIIKGTVSAGAAGSIQNTASVQPPPGVTDPVPDNNVSTVSIGPAPGADLEIVKSGPPAIAPGFVITYTLTARNLGPADAFNTRITDIIPAQISGVSWTCSALGTSTCGTSSGSGNAIDILVNLPSGSSNTVTVAVTGTVSPAARGTLTNTATVTPPAGLLDPNPANNVSPFETVLTPTADLAIVKTGPANPVPGSQVAYQLVVTNNGPSDVTGATITDAVPEVINSVQWNCTTTSGAVCTPQSGSGNLVSLAASIPAGSAQVIVNITGTLSPGVTGTVTNTASVVPPLDTTDPNPVNNSAGVANPVNPVADLVLVKSGPAAVVPGGPVSYTITVTNAGPSHAVGVLVTDNIPPIITNVTFTCAATGGSTCGAPDGSGNSISVIASILALPGNSVVITVQGTVSTSAAGSFQNTASVRPPAGLTDPDPTNNDSIVTTTVSPVTLVAADLAVAKAGPASYIPGGVITYLLTCTNHGPAGVTAALVTDTVPPAISGVSWTCVATGNAACGASSGVGNSISVPVDIAAGAGNSVSIAITGSVVAGTSGPLSNSAQISPPAGVTDSEPGNNTSGVSAMPGALAADLAIVKSGPLAAQPGQQLTYVLTVTNLGPANVQGALVSDVVPPSLEAVTWTCVSSGTASCGAASGSGNNISLPVSLDAGPANSVLVTVTGTVVAGASGNLTNTAIVAPPAGVTDPNPANDTSTVITPVSGVADLVVEKVAGISEPKLGERFSYSITVLNRGPMVAPNVILNDPLPSELTLISVTSTKGSCDQNIRCVLGQMAVGEKVTITLYVAPLRLGQIGNVARAVSDLPDPVPDDNTSTSTIWSVENPNPPAEIPTLPEIGLIAFTLLLAVGGWLLLKGRGLAG